MPEEKKGTAEEIAEETGKIIGKGFKKGVKPLEDEVDRRKMYMELVLRVTTRREFDYCLGPVKYSASRREKVVTLSFPLGGNVLLVSTNPDVEIDKTAAKIMKICSRQNN